ncbi:MAG TPA: lysophospholipid acyltransferase family protein [Cyclobacteriaceae bacterium]|nr:lysophospholipid acyltransferase family protein [Cyclobacteriaceae bacterium]
MFFVTLLSRLPLSVLYFFSDFLFVVSFYVVRYRRKLVQKNLKNAFPEKKLAELKVIEKEFYVNLCDYAVETLKLLTISREELGKRMIFKNAELALKYAENGHSVLHLTSHQFNWEWGLVTACLTFPFQMDFVYQSVSSKFFEELSLKIRTRFGAHPIKRDEVARETIKRKSILRGIALMADQYPGYGRDKKYETKFLNQDTVFFYGANQLAVLMQYPVVFYELRKMRRGYYQATIVNISSPPYNKESDIIIESYVRGVEKVIQENPAGWLWTHNRWKKRHLRKA